MKVALIQLNSTADKKSNLLQVKHWVTKAYEASQPELIALPEMFTFIGGDLSHKKANAESIGYQSDAISLLQELAANFKIYIHGGSICEFSDDKYYNSTFVFGPEGQIITKYRKINLFSFASTHSQYNEAKWLSPGHNIITYTLNGIVIGCAICFDLRFGNIFQELIRKKVDLIIIPSAFTYETGQAHWEILCRARAIETQSYLIAPAQTGVHHEQGQSRKCFGHSMLVDPWGTIIAQLDEAVGYVSTTLDFNFLSQVRKRLPCVDLITA